MYGNIAFITLTSWLFTSLSIEDTGGGVLGAGLVIDLINFNISLKSIFEFLLSIKSSFQMVSIYSMLTQ
jgi:hypothetical protein